MISVTAWALIIPYSLYGLAFSPPSLRINRIEDIFVDAGIFIGDWIEPYDVSGGKPDNDIDLAGTARQHVYIMTYRVGLCKEDL